MSKSDSENECKSYRKRDYDSCDSYKSESCYSSSSDSDKCDKRRKRRHRRKSNYYCPPPSCPKPCFGKNLAAKLCPCKLDHCSKSCANGYACFNLNNSNRTVRWCVKVYELDCKEKCINAYVHNAGPCDPNTECNIVNELCLKRYKQQTRYDDYCGCKYLYVGRGKWECEDKHYPLTPANAELLACGLLNVQVNNEVRGQLCSYRSL